jgi:hypothetical protein
MFFSSITFDCEQRNYATNKPTNYIFKLASANTGCVFGTCRAKCYLSYWSCGLFRRNTCWIFPCLLTNVIGREECSTAHWIYIVRHFSSHNFNNFNLITAVRQERKISLLITIVTCNLAPNLTVTVRLTVILQLTVTVNVNFGTRLLWKQFHD